VRLVLRVMWQQLHKKMMSQDDAADDPEIVEVVGATAPCDAGKPEVVEVVLPEVVAATAPNDDVEPEVVGVVTATTSGTRVPKPGTVKVIAVTVLRVQPNEGRDEGMGRNVQ
jgi:hypothetical protein